MFTLAWHIVAISIIVAMVWSIAYNRGSAAGERRLRRRLGLDEHGAEDAPPARQEQERSG